MPNPNPNTNPNPNNRSSSRPDMKALEINGGDGLII